MIPFVRSLAELMAMSQSRAQKEKRDKNYTYNPLTEDSGQRKRYIRSKVEKGIDLPNLPKRTNQEWRKSKEAVSKFFSELDYNNQIQSSYDLTLLERQKTFDHHDVA